MENAKQKAIEVAYGSLYEKYKESINSDGYVRFGNKGNTEYIELNTNVDFEEKEWIGYYFLRPKSLAGIEHNFNWISINSEEDLPKITHKETRDISLGHVWAMRIDGFISIINLEKLTHDNHSHYQPTIKPKKPIY